MKELSNQTKSYTRLKIRKRQAIKHNIWADVAKRASCLLQCLPFVLLLLSRALALSHTTHLSCALSLSLSPSSCLPLSLTLSFCVSQHESVRISYYIAYIMRYTLYIMWYDIHSILCTMQYVLHIV